MTTWSLNQNNLSKYLTHAGLEPLLERESGLTYINIQAEDHELPLFFVIRNEGEILQMICYFPYQLYDNQREATARLLHLLNRDVDIPGFGMDEEQGLIFYRLVIPCLQGEINEILLRVYIDTIRLVCDSFSHSIGLISSGNMNLDELKKQARKEKNE
ncbi:YbjN domain-containing protein [Chlamydia buteonis]|uniref:YbjN domain-containing protein n=1 Tax=Chlamydia buteonis TaxID=2494525 RepID=A0ABX8LCI9_9CHLA|nr:YbjN domain-containing protein [Chlamydia buteonis]QXE27202.1 bacterial sensory transduction regulator family protein [Chlamydia buteonis]QXE27879.1 YbjN domain-containing protein [Chlamydia buteonis]